jgi:tetratricopeptide (TPR) repeat protein
MGRGRIEEAIAHYQEALRLRPGYATAHNNLGLAFLERGRPVEAIAQYRKALGIEPENAALHTNLGDALMAQGEAKEALVHFQEALRIEPNDPRPYNNLAWIRATHPDPRLRDGKEAVDLAERACGLWGGNHPNLLDTLAAAYAEEGRFVEAVATAEKALAASTGLNDLASEIEGRLEGYKAGRPFRESRATSGHGAS